VSSMSLVNWRREPLSLLTRLNGFRSSVTRTAQGRTRGLVSRVPSRAMKKAGSIGRPYLDKKCYGKI
jgi:hypothetical protein